MHGTNRRPAAAAIALSLVVLSACSSQKPGPTKTAFLTSEPSASIALRFDPGTKTIHVSVQGTGFLRSTGYQLQIRYGTCLKPNRFLSATGTITSDRAGSINDSAGFDGTFPAIPANIHVDLAIPAAGSPPIVVGCTDVPPKKPTTSLGLFPPPHLRGGGSFTARFRNDRTLSLRISLVGLPPNSVHAVGIYAGSCAMQGRLDTQLGNIGVDDQGSASATKVVRLASKSGALYLGVTFGSTSDIDSPGAQAPVSRLILCGDMPARSSKS